jgi:hypothetical protein
MIQSALFSFSADSFDSMAGEEEEAFVIRRGAKACVNEQRRTAGPLFLNLMRGPGQ